MKRLFFISSLLVIGTVTSASADGLAVPEYYGSNFNWNGAYIGGHFGWARTRETLHDIDGYNSPCPCDFSQSIDNPFGGAQAGYNFGYGGFVYGLEGEIGWLALDDSKQFPPFAGVRLPDDSRDSIEGGVYGTITGRLGYAFGNFLLYGKAGWGFADVDARFVDTDPTGALLVSGTHKNATLTGAVFGGGIEFAVTDSATFKVEYLRLDIGDTLTHTAVTDLGGPFRFGHEIDAIDTVKVGFNIKLNREAPPPPPLK